MIEIKTLIQSFHLQQAVDRTTRTCYLKQNQYYGEKFLSETFQAKCIQAA